MLLRQKNPRFAGTGAGMLLRQKNPRFAGTGAWDAAGTETLGLPEWCLGCLPRQKTLGLPERMPEIPARTENPGLAGTGAWDAWQDRKTSTCQDKHLPKTKNRLSAEKTDFQAGMLPVACR